MVKKKLTLQEALLPMVDTEEDLVIAWAKQYDVRLQKVGEAQYKVLNGCIKNIMLYPTKYKLMFQEVGRNYVITSLTDTSIIDLIKGNIAYKKSIT